MVTKSLKKGTTLIEVLVSSTILAIAITPLLWSFVMRQELLRRSNLKLEATRLLNQRLEVISRMPDSTAVDTYLAQTFIDSITPSGTDINKIVYTTKFAKSLVDLWNKTGNQNKKIHQFTATVEWDFKGNKEELSIVSRAQY